MTKINFKALEVQTSFDGDKRTVDVTKTVGNMMMYNGSVLLDIGFEDLAKEIYYSEGEVEVPARYAAPVKEVVRQSPLVAAVKREIIKRLSNEE